ncbi:MAG: phosphotransferase [Bacteroidota bacterium]
MQIDLKTPITDVQQYLSAKGWIDKTEHILATEKPGEGNMNVVLRIKTNLRTFILKQSRPYVQKYKEVEAPLERINVEYQFYRHGYTGTLKQYFPEALAYDGHDHLLMLEDLGTCEDMTYIYNSKVVPKERIESLVQIVKAIHNTTIAADFPKNLKLRQLNHQHIFELPFMMDNGFSLNKVQEGLQELSEPYKRNKDLKSIIKRLGEKYLSPGEVLVHGDYYPGSWMTCADRIHIIDPEFCFLGFAEFDVGVMAAHIIMATMEMTYLDTIANQYGDGLDSTLVEQIAGVEIMRRIIGLAQLPLDSTLEEKESLLNIAHKMIML